MPTTYNKLVAKMFSLSEELEREVKELKFGCVLKDGCCLYTYCSESKDFIYLRTKENEEYQEWKTRVSKFEIIGRDLTLEDVLKVLNKKCNKNEFVEINDNGDIISNIGQLKEHDICHYEFGIPLQNQEEETLKKLLEILS